MTSASVPPTHRAINSFVFFMFVSDVCKRINNEWAALAGHIFHLAEMALMQSVCITLPITELGDAALGKRDVQTKFKACWTQVWLQCKWPSFQQNSAAAISSPAVHKLGVYCSGELISSSHNCKLPCTHRGNILLGWLVVFMQSILMQNK